MSSAFFWSKRSRSLAICLRSRFWVTICSLPRAISFVQARAAASCAVGLAGGEVPLGRVQVLVAQRAHPHAVRLLGALRDHVGGHRPDVVVHLLQLRVPHLVMGAPRIAVLVPAEGLPLQEEVLEDAGANRCWPYAGKAVELASDVLDLRGDDEDLVEQAFREGVGPEANADLAVPLLQGLHLDPLNGGQESRDLRQQAGLHRVRQSEGRPSQQNDEERGRTCPSSGRAHGRSPGNSIGGSTWGLPRRTRST